MTTYRVGLEDQGDLEGRAGLEDLKKFTNFFATSFPYLGQLSYLFNLSVHFKEKTILK